MSSTEPALYSGWQAERSGFMGNLSGLGFTMVAAASIIALIPIYTRSWSTAFIALPLALLLLALAFGRVLGLTADEWIVLAVRHQIAVATNRNFFFSGLFAPRRSADDAQPMDLPGTLARMRLLEAPDGLGGELAIMHDPIEGTYTAVCQVSYPGLALIDTDKQNARVRGWAAFLRSQCMEDGAIIRIAVHQRSLPDDGGTLRSWADRHISPDAPAAAVQVLSELMEGAGPAATVRETYLSVTLSASRARLAIKGAGGGQIGAAAVLVREISAMHSALSSAGLHVMEWLSPRAMAQVIRTAYDPEAHISLSARATSAEDPQWQGTAAGVDPELAGPAATETGWGIYRHDGAWTVTYQVRGFPRSDVYATFLQPLLRPRSNARRSLSLVYEPIGPNRARSELAREKTKRQVAKDVRAKTGRAESEDERREAVTAHAQDVARASGHGVLRFTALVAVTVTDREELETACAELQADASAANLEIRRAWGAQDAAFAVSALPLGQGLPDRRVGM